VIAAQSRSIRDNIPSNLVSFLCIFSWSTYDGASSNFG
jgi:hypothetical protein